MCCKFFCLLVTYTYLYFFLNVCCITINQMFIHHRILFLQCFLIQKHIMILLNDTNNPLLMDCYTSFPFLKSIIAFRFLVKCYIISTQYNILNWSLSFSVKEQEVLKAKQKNCQSQFTSIQLSKLFMWKMNGNVFLFQVSIFVGTVFSFDCENHLKIKSLSVLVFHLWNVSCIYEIVIELHHLG